MQNLNKPISSLLCAVTLCFLTSCTVTKRGPITDISVGGVPTITSSKSAAISFQSGTIDGDQSNVYFGGPGISVGKEPQFFFNRADQAQFKETLRRELLRLAVIGSSPDFSANSRADLDIKVVFDETYRHASFNKFTLFVTMNVSGGKVPLIKTYRINSNEGATDAEMWKTDVYQGKAKAIRKLLEKTIPDIQAYVDANK